MKEETEFAFSNCIISTHVLVQSWKQLEQSLHDSCRCFWRHVITRANKLDEKQTKCPLNVMFYAWACMNPSPQSADEAACQALSTFSDITVSQLQSFSNAIAPAMVNLALCDETRGLHSNIKACLENITCFEKRGKMMILHDIPWGVLQDIDAEEQVDDGRRVVHLSAKDLNRVLSCFAEDPLGQFARQIIVGIILSSPNYWFDMLDMTLMSEIQPRSVVWLSEFGHCENVSYWRGAEQMPLNLQQSFDDVYSNDVQDIVFMTAFPDCASKGKGKLRRILDVSGSLLLKLKHCSRDKDSYSRMLVAWELLKRGHGVFNIDPDIVLFHKFPSHIFDSDLTFAFYNEHEHLHKGLGDDDANNLSPAKLMGGSNFGTWYWSNSTKATLTYASFYVMYLWDLQGSRDQPKGYNTPEELAGDLGNVNQICDDQIVFHRLLKHLTSREMFHNFSFGAQTMNLHDEGMLHMRVLKPAEMALAVTYIRSSDEERSKTYFAMHMSTFGSWKVHGLRELGLWFQRIESDSCSRVISLDQVSFDSLKSAEEVHAVLLRVLSICDSLGITFQLPLLNCSFVTHASRVQNQRSYCEWFFQYDFTTLVDSGISFLPHNYVQENCGGARAQILSEGTTATELGQIFVALLPGDINAHVILAGDLTRLSAEGMNFTTASFALTENVRVHGCC